MAVNDPRMQFGSAVGTRAGAAVDQGLRAFMLAVYNHMAIGVALTGVVALGMFKAATQEVDGRLLLTPFGQTFYHSPLQWLFILAPFAIVLWMSFGAQRLSASTARTLFYVYAALMGVSISTILLVYTGNSVARTFFIAAASFGALSLYGYTTRRDLTAIGSFLVMGLIGLVLASLVSMIWPSGMMQFIISVAGVGIFAGLTAYETQMLKNTYRSSASTEETNKIAIYGALNLYMDFLNLFLYLMRLLGDRR